MTNILKHKSISSLRWKIYYGFGVLILILILNGILGFYGLGSAMQSFDRYREVERTNNEALSIDRNVHELKLRVNQYIYTGHTSNRDAAQATHKNLRTQINDLLLTVEDQQISESLKIMNTHLEEYFRNFSLATEERQLRYSLVQTSLPQQGQSVLKTLELIESQFNNNESSNNYLSILSAQRFFSLAEENALRYFAQPSSPYVDKTLAALQGVRSKIKLIQIEKENSEEQQINNLLKQLDEYQRICLRAFQATRSYLYLVNVVMSGEASEFAYYSSQIKSIAETKRLEINQATLLQAQNIKNFTSFAILAALVIGLFLAGRLTYSVVQPITAMTQTFRKLVAGETLLSIPATERNDEIGEMAVAADILNKKNQETKELLEQSQKLSQELTHKTQQLEIINSELDSFAYVASHDLKSPLRGIHQLADWIQEDSAKTLSEESSEYLNKLQGRIKVMEELLNDLLEYSRIGRENSEIEIVDTKIMVNQLIDIIDYPDNFQISVSPDMPTLKTFPTPLRQVFLNLVTNAIKHHDHKKAGKIDIECHELMDFYEFSISDNGPGIAPKHHARIFQMYQRVGNTSVEGSGMGLAIIKKQIETCGGVISVDSEQGKNTVFRFTWPK